MSSKADGWIFLVCLRFIVFAFNEDLQESYFTPLLLSYKGHRGQPCRCYMNFCYNLGCFQFAWVSFTWFVLVLKLLAHTSAFYTGRLMWYFRHPFHCTLWSNLNTSTLHIASHQSIDEYLHLQGQDSYSSLDHETHFLSNLIKNNILSVVRLNLHASYQGLWRLKTSL